MANDNFNDPSDKEYLKSQVQKDMEDGIVPIDFEVIAGEKNFLSEIRDPDSMIESVNNISDTYKRFGQEYGIEIKFDVESVSSTFKSIISDDAEKVFGLYVSKTFNKAKLSIFNKILISITTLVDRVTQKDILESENIELSVGLIEKLLFLMEKVNVIHKELRIESADMLLKNLSKEIKTKGNLKEGDDFSQDDIMDLLRAMKKSKTTN